MIGFKFRGKHSNDFNIGTRSIDRTVLPEKRRIEYTIPGKSGTLEFESDLYEKREISMVLGLMKTETWEELRLKAREIAGWLTGYGQLIFDDEPDKAYEATVYNSIGIEQLMLLPKGTINIAFECQPFAESVDLNRIVEINANRRNVTVENKGNVKTCGTIIIKNNDNQIINNLLITRKVVI